MLPASQICLTNCCISASAFDRYLFCNLLCMPMAADAIAVFNSPHCPVSSSSSYHISPIIYIHVYNSSLIPLLIPPSDKPMLYMPSLSFGQNTPHVVSRRLHLWNLGVVDNNILSISFLQEPQQYWHFILSRFICWGIREYQFAGMGSDLLLFITLNS